MPNLAGNQLCLLFLRRGVNMPDGPPRVFADSVNGEFQCSFSGSCFVGSHGDNLQQLHERGLTLQFSFGHLEFTDAPSNSDCIRSENRDENGQPDKKVVVRADKNQIRRRHSSAFAQFAKFEGPPYEYRQCRILFHRGELSSEGEPNPKYVFENEDGEGVQLIILLWWRSRWSKFRQHVLNEVTPSSWPRLSNRAYGFRYVRCRGKIWKQLSFLLVARWRPKVDMIQDSNRKSRNQRWACRHQSRDRPKTHAKYATLPP